MPLSAQWFVKSATTRMFRLSFASRSSCVVFAISDSPGLVLFSIALDRLDRKAIQPSASNHVVPFRRGEATHTIGAHVTDALHCDVVLLCDRADRYAMLAHQAANHRAR